MTWPPRRLNRYLALAGLGTRRGVEGLVRAGRVAVDGVVAREPAQPVEPGATVTLDGEPAVDRRGRPACSCGAGAARCRALAHPSELHLARERRPTAAWRCCSATSGWPGACARSATTRAACGGSPSGAFRPLDAGELDAARGVRAAHGVATRT